MPPLITTLVPADDATDVAVDTDLVMTFNEDVQAGTGDVRVKKIPPIVITHAASGPDKFEARGAPGPYTPPGADEPDPNVANRWKEVAGGYGGKVFLLYPAGSPGAPDPPNDSFFYTNYTGANPVVGHWAEFKLEVAEAGTYDVYGHWPDGIVTPPPPETQTDIDQGASIPGPDDDVQYHFFDGSDPDEIATHARRQGPASVNAGNAPHVPSDFQWLKQVTITGTELRVRLFRQVGADSETGLMCADAMLAITADADETVETIDITSGSVSIVDDTVTIDIADLEASTGYYVEVDATAIENLASEPFAGIDDETTWNFATEEPSDVTAPTVLTLTPADDATDVAVDTTLVMVFDEDVQAVTGDVRVKLASDDSTVQTIDITSGSVSIDGDTVTITISELDPGTDYYVEVDATAIDDLADNSYAGIADATTWNFSTVSNASDESLMGVY